MLYEILTAPSYPKSEAFASSVEYPQRPAQFKHTDMRGAFIDQSLSSMSWKEAAGTDRDWARERRAVAPRGDVRLMASVINAKRITQPIEQVPVGRPWHHKPRAAAA